MAKGTAQAQNDADADNQGVDFEDGESYTFNMNETEEDSGFAPIPKGRYLCTIEKCAFEISKSSGSPMWNLTLAIAEGEFAEKNRKLFSYISLKPEQRGRVKQFLNRVAPELATLDNFNPKKVADEGVLLGKMCVAKVDIGKTTPEYPEPRNQVKDILSPDTTTTGGSTGGGAGGKSFEM